MKCLIKNVLNWFSRKLKESFVTESVAKVFDGSSSSAFRILVVKVFSKCDTKIRKCLKEDVLYLLCGDYEGCNRYVYDVEGRKEKVRINVSAIGKDR